MIAIGKQVTSIKRGHNTSCSTKYVKRKALKKYAHDTDLVTCQNYFYI